MSDIAIQGRDLHKRFRIDRDKRTSLKERLVRGRSRGGEEFWAVRGVDLDIERGTTFGLIGHNGSGKSTLLKLLAGIYRPTSGTIAVDGRVSALLELGAGFHGDLTGRQNVYLNGAILGLSRKRIARAMDQIVDFSGIGDFIDAPVKVYSSGMYVRLGFSVAVMVDPEILIVDEIIAVGDEEFQRKCFDHLHHLRRQGTTIVLVSHSLGLMGDMCDRAMWLDHGVPQCTGEAREVVDRYLRAVNAKEAELTQPAPDHATVDGTAAPPRLGSGEARVTGLTVCDDAGRPVPFLSPGTPCRFVMTYEAGTRVPDAVFGLGFVHESGVTVAGPNSGDEDRSFTLEAGTGRVEYRLPALPLQPGSYRVSVAIVDRGHMFDYRDRAFELVVRADHSSQGHGLVRFDGTWGRGDTAVGGGPLTDPTPVASAVSEPARTEETLRT